MTSAHTHRFDEATWPFAVPVDTHVFASVRVLRHGMPIVVVQHDDEGDWQFSCGSTGAPEHAVIACIGCLFDADPSLGELADLPVGWQAWRVEPQSPWERGEADPDAGGPPDNLWRF